MMTPEAFAAQAGVSRETMAKFRIYLERLEKWQERVNLVGPSTLADPWRRHFLDSAQILSKYREVHGDDGARTWLDLGSGAGFPGLVLALLGAGRVHLIEANRKKCAFLREVIRATRAGEVTVHNLRIEALEPFPVDVITGRAVAPLAEILSLSGEFCRGPVEYWLLKGRRAQEELTEAGKYWKLKSTLYPSLSDKSGAVLRLWECKRVQAA